jgi:polyphosphate:AMP phosphotransferase
MMFRTAELGQKVSKEEFDKLAPALRTEMLELQQRLRSAKFPVIIVFAGVDGAGKGECVNLLNEWMDPRWIVTRAYRTPSEEEIERPEYWRYWRDLPPKGRFGLYLRSWYSRPVLEHVHGQIDDEGLDAELDRIVNFEKTLADDNALILKFWMHLGKAQQKKRLKTLEKDKLERWKVTPTDWKNYEMYDRFIIAAERALQRSGTGFAPWTIVEGMDSRFRSLTVATAIRDAVTKHLDAEDQRKQVKAVIKKAAAEAAPAAASSAIQRPKAKTVLGALDMTQTVTNQQYSKQLRELRSRLAVTFRKAREKGVASVMMFEGWDAAGKGSAIRRVTAALQPGDYKVIPVAAPTDEERAQHYLWRFWRHLGRAGELVIFDRSWYGRVLVERIEHFARDDEWQRAYAEINHFEDELTRHGIVLSKFWVHITKEEQEARFKARAETSFKSWKLTEEDWRNRAKWDEYEAGVHDLVERTSTRSAPWTLVEGNDKKFARIKILETYVDRLETAIKHKKK